MFFVGLTLRARLGLHKSQRAVSGSGTQRLQYPLIKEYTLIPIRKPL